MGENRERAISERQQKCRHYKPGMDISGKKIIHQCNQGDTLKGPYRDVTAEECENCERYKSRFIEFPITVNGINPGKIEIPSVLYRDYIGEPCAVRICGKEHAGKTYFGIHLGELPRYITASYREDTKELTQGVMENPAILVPELKTIIFGDSSYWKVLEKPEDFSEITDQDIEAQWYVRAAREMMGARDEKDIRGTEDLS